MQQNATQVRFDLVISPLVVSTLDAYADDLAARKLSESTVETYVREVAMLAAWLGDESTIADVTLVALGRYQRGRKKLSGASLAKTVAALRSYCSWCVDLRLRPDNPALGLKSPRRAKTLPKPLSTGQLVALDALLVAGDGLPRWAARRPIWRLAILIMLYAGLRIAEVSRLDWRDVDIDAGLLLVRAGKGGKDRALPLHRRILAEMLRVPLLERRGLVVGMSVGGLHHMFDRWLLSGGLDIHAHMLRHTFATRLLWSGADIRTIQALMGHASLATTERYLGLDVERGRAAVAGLPDQWG